MDSDGASVAEPTKRVILCGARNCGASTFALQLADMEGLSPQQLRVLLDIVQQRLATHQPEEEATARYIARNRARLERAGHGGELTRADLCHLHPLSIGVRQWVVDIGDGSMELFEIAVRTAQFESACSFVRNREPLDTTVLYFVKDEFDGDHFRRASEAWRDTPLIALRTGACTQGPLGVPLDVMDKEAVEQFARTLLN